MAIDSRGARQLDPDDRRMVNAPEWRWITEQATGGHDHLILGTSIPWLMTPGMHDLQRFDEAISQGAWGSLVAKAGEWIRQAYDLEHWPAWGTSWLEFAELARSVGAGEKGAAPATIIALSGDVHHAYLTEAEWSEGVESRVWQATCSPVRNPLSKKEAAGMRLLRTKPLARLANRLADAAGAYQAPMTWQECRGPVVRQPDRHDRPRRARRADHDRALARPHGRAAAPGGLARAPARPRRSRRRRARRARSGPAGRSGDLNDRDRARAAAPAG